jgi:ubiquinone/menaquinone biosynthesis C-methylase UbiE
MCDCCQPSCALFFDSIAPTWDRETDLESLNVKLDEALEHFGIKPDEYVLDVGCGTGNLTAAILRRLSHAGRITAVDISSRMVEIARGKIHDSRVQWICDAVEHLDGLKDLYDSIICYSVWPHLKNPQKAGWLFWDLLKTGGKLYLWHLISREAVNKIHREASEAVNNHILAPANETASMLRQEGFSIEEIRDDDTGYLVTARKTPS